ERVLNSKTGGLPIGQAHAPYDLGVAAGDDFLDHCFVFVRIDLNLVDTKSRGLRLYPPIGTPKRPSRHDTGRLGTNPKTVFTVSDACDPYARVNAEFGSRAQPAIHARGRRGGSSRSA